MKKIKKFIAIILILAVLVPLSLQSVFASTGENLETLTTETPQSIEVANNETTSDDNDFAEAENLTSETDISINDIEESKDNIANSENAKEPTDTNIPINDINGDTNKKINETSANENSQSSETVPDNNKEERPSTDEEQDEVDYTKQPSLDVPENNNDEQLTIGSEQNEASEKEIEKDVTENDNEIKPQLSEDEPLEKADEGIESLAEDSTDWEYTDNGDGTVTITKYSGADTEVTVPAILDNKSVTNIKGEHINNTYIPCFKSDVTKVILPQSLTSIGPLTFYKCRLLTSISIPENVTNIGSSAFNGCSSLINLTIPEGMVSIGDSAFSWCYDLASITIPKSLSSIGKNAFYHCSSLTNLTILEGVTNIGVSAFAFCSSLTSVEIPNSITSINDHTFSSCSALSNVKIPQSVTSIGICAFAGCTSLENITIPIGVTRIGGGAFQNCSLLINVTIPESVTIIEDSAFYNDISLTSLSFSATLSTLGNKIVDGCSKLTSIKFLGNAPATNGETLGTGLPANYETIYNPGATGFTNPWRGYPAREETPTPESDWEYGNNSDGTVTITKYKGRETEVTVPGTLDGKKVTAVKGAWGGSAYIPCFGSQIISVILPQSMTSIGKGAFYDCINLTSINIPRNVTSIGNYAFSGCTTLTNVTIPQGVTSIGDASFSRCESLTNITIPQGVTNIPWAAFESCTALTSITIPQGVTIIESHAFNNCTSLSRINIPQSITNIENRAFQRCTSLINVTIPQALTSIGEYAFHFCTSLTSLTFPTSLTSLGTDVVSFCSNLTSIKFLGDAPATNNSETLGSGLPSNYKTIYTPGTTGFTTPKWRGYPTLMEGAAQPTSDWEYIVNPDNTTLSITKYKGTPHGMVTIPLKLTVNGIEKTVTKIADNALANHSEITSLTIPSTITTMGNKAFAFCNNLTNVTIPASVVSSNTGGTNSGEWFYDCQKLSTVTFQDGATIIPAWALAHMPVLTTVNIPASVRTIGAYAFYGCPKLSAPTIPNQVTNIGNNAFSGSGVITITVPSGVTKVEPDTFKDCDNLTQVNLPSTVTHIKQYAFTGCSNLTTITIPEGPQVIEDGAFQNCNKLTFLVIPASVTTMGDRVVEGCSALRYIEFKGNAPKYTGSGDPILAPKQPLSAKLPDNYVSKYHYGKTGFPPTGEIWRNWPVLMLGAPGVSEYTVTFKDHDGTVLKTQTVASGAAATAPPNPTRAGYTFRKWDNDFSTVTSNLTVTAVYIQNGVTLPKYTVIFKDWDGREISKQTVEEEKSANKPADPTREGYTFIGWDKPFNSVTEDLTITAQYKINEYTVAFKDWDGNTLKTETVEYKRAATAPENPTCTGYTFKNWDKPFDSVTENLTVTAHYTINSYTVTFKDWDGNTLKTQTVDYQQTATAPSNPTRSGYTFIGWDKPFNSITADTVVTAQYEKNAAEFTVTFNDWNGVQLNSQKVKEGGAAQAPASPTRWGYTFTGWDKPFDKITGDTTITAQYSLRDAADVSGEELKKLDPNDPNYYDKLKELEEKYKELYNIKVGIDVDRNTHSNFHANSNKIDVIGAAFNAKPNETLSLRFSKPDTNVTINGERYKTNNAIQVDVNLLNSGKNMGKLTHPILIKAPVPGGLDPEDFRILHYHADGSIEKIKPKLNGDGTCTFTVNSFSVFAFVEEITANQPQIPDYNKPQIPDYNQPQIPGYNQPQIPGNGSIQIPQTNNGGSVARQNVINPNANLESVTVIETTLKSPKTGDDYPNVWDRLFYLIAIPLLMFLLFKVRNSCIKR